MYTVHSQQWEKTFSSAGNLDIAIVLVVQKHYHNSCVNKLSSGISTFQNHLLYRTS
jgi:hypothetical protein